jgi:hypothetical protein
MSKISKKRFGREAARFSPVWFFTESKIYKFKSCLSYFMHVPYQVFAAIKPCGNQFLSVQIRHATH